MIQTDLRSSGAEFSELVGFRSEATPETTTVHGTTVLAIRFDEGALVLADRRATMGHLIMYEDANKIEALDDRTVIAISGAYARSVEICRYLRHAFKYYERLNLFEISTEGKLMEISRALSGNLPAAATGGVFLPIAATYDPKADEFGVHFFDMAGARFLGADYAAAGSGSERIRGAFEYSARMNGPFRERSRDDVLREGLNLLDIASQLDSATGGIVPKPPKCTVLTRSGVEHLSAEELQPYVDSALRRVSVAGLEDDPEP